MFRCDFHSTCTVVRILPPQQHKARRNRQSSRKFPHCRTHVRHMVAEQLWRWAGRGIGSCDCCTARSCPSHSAWAGDRRAGTGPACNARRCIAPARSDHSSLGSRSPLSKCAIFPDTRTRVHRHQFSTHKCQTSPGILAICRPSNREDIR